MVMQSVRAGSISLKDLHSISKGRCPPFDIGCLDRSKIFERSLEISIEREMPGGWLKSPCDPIIDDTSVMVYKS